MSTFSNSTQNPRQLRVIRQNHGRPWDISYPVHRDWPFDSDILIVNRDWIP